jgi:hypothetical protein
MLAKGSIRQLSVIELDGAVCRTVVQVCTLSEFIFLFESATHVFKRVSRHEAIIHGRMIYNGGRQLILIRMVSVKLL